MKTSAIRFRLIAIGALFIAAVVIGYFIIRPSNELPIYNPSQLDPRLVGDEAKGDTGVHHILPFHLIDQDGDSVSLADVKGKVVLADFFFTTCGSICPKMSTQLIRVQEKYKDEDRLMLLSHSVTPETDSVPVLKAYAEKYGVYHKRWRLMTGSREQIYRQLNEELPYASGVRTERYEERGDGSVAIHQQILVGRDSQKAIVLGKGGARLKEIGSKARAELAGLLGRPVHLFLHVKVDPVVDEDRDLYP